MSHRMFSNKTNENVSPGSKKHHLKTFKIKQMKKCLKFSTALISYDTSYATAWLIVCSKRRWQQLFEDPTKFLQQKTIQMSEKLRALVKTFYERDDVR